MDVQIRIVHVTNMSVQLLHMFCVIDMLQQAHACTCQADDSTRAKQKII